jgi:hypothetical protein
MSVTDADLTGTFFGSSASEPPSSLLALEEPGGELTTYATVTWSNELTNSAVFTPCFMILLQSYHLYKSRNK